MEIDRTTLEKRNGLSFGVIRTRFQGKFIFSEIEKNTILLWL
jgi:hypothetical protein